MEKANKDVEQGAFMRVLLNFSEHTFTEQLLVTTSQKAFIYFFEDLRKKA